MTEIKEITACNKADANIANEPFELSGKVNVRYENGRWEYSVVRFAPENVKTMKFPDENYDTEAMENSVFLGAYNGEKCIGLAVLQPGFFRYMYLLDLKVSSACRGAGVGSKLIEKAKEEAKKRGYAGIYTQCQDNNPGAFLFYMKNGFYIGGLDTNVYRHTPQEEKSDILLYAEAEETAAGLCPETRRKI